MYPFFKLWFHIQQAKRAPTLSLDETCIIKMRVGLLSDCDIFLEMNNGRHLTLFDIGRFAFAVRTGLWATVKQQGWGFVVAGSSVRYRKRLKPWQCYEQHTRVVGHDEKWFYFLQSHQVGEVWHSAALIRAAVVEKGKILPTQLILDKMNQSEWQPQLPEWVQAWIQADALWPWPVAK
jgi:acyl-CoA thioesterase FadM